MSKLYANRNDIGGKVLIMFICWLNQCSNISAFRSETAWATKRFTQKSKSFSIRHQQITRTTRRFLSTTVDGSGAAETSTSASVPPADSLPKPLDVNYSMDEIMSLCKRRGIIFPSSEIYNGYAGFYDFGPLGVELKNNIKQYWWKTFVTQREDVVGLDSSIIHNPATWKASGHVDGFSDPMVDCKETKLRFRADQLLFAPVLEQETGELLGYVCVQDGNESDKAKDAKKQVKALLKEQNRASTLIQDFDFRELTEATEDEMAQIPSPACGKPGMLTMPRDFNLMFTTQVGALTDESSKAYLRPETAQGIFLNFKNVLTTSRQKIPFGIAQIGKAFRNEITPRNYIFRSREFEQMEVEYFIPPGDEIWPQYHQQWINASMQFLLNCGLRPDLLGWDVHEQGKLAHYAQACTDIVFQFPFGTQELMGIAARGNYDLSQHSKESGKSLEYFDEETKARYVAHCIEPSLGVDRLLLALICSAYAMDEIAGEKRTILRFDPKIAPIKVAVLPLVKNKAELVSFARALYEKLQKRWNCQWDASGAVGRRYRRADEAGTPFCVTVDFDTIQKDNSVTVRNRDTTQQIRMPIENVFSYLSQAIDGF